MNDSTNVRRRLAALVLGGGLTVGALGAVGCAASPEDLEGTGAVSQATSSACSSGEPVGSPSGSYTCISSMSASQRAQMDAINASACQSYLSGSFPSSPVICDGQSHSLYCCHP